MRCLAIRYEKGLVNKSGSETKRTLPSVWATQEVLLERFAVDIIIDARINPYIRSQFN